MLKNLKTGFANFIANLCFILPLLREFFYTLKTLKPTLKTAFNCLYLLNFFPKIQNLVASKLKIWYIRVVEIS